MKIAVISPNKSHLQEIDKVLQAGPHATILVEGGKSKVRDVAEHEQPDLMLVDGMCCDHNELAQVEYVTMHYPTIAIVLLCASTTPDFLINSMRAGVREVLPSPVMPAALEAAVNRIATKLRGIQANPPGKLLAFLSCKGGSGATFLATNLGSQLGETKSVLLIDLNLQFGDALSFLHDGKPASTIADVARDIGRLDASFLAASTVKVSPNYSILAAPDDPSQSIEITPEHVESILSLAVNHYDFVLLDLGRPINTLSVKALDRATTIFPVMQAGLPYIRNAKKMLGIFQSLGYPSNRIELIINRFEKGSAIGMAEVERSLGKLAIHTVPNSYKQVAASINHGDPLMVSARGNPVARNLATFARTLSPHPGESRNLFERLLGRAA
jgi:pilus assembly protein CpaE